MKIKLILILLLVFPVCACAEGLEPLKLPKPKMQGGLPLMQALKERKSSREFSSKELSLEVISDLLWAASGVNRPETGLRTSPTSMNMQELDIYLAKADGLYLYEAKAHTLLPVVLADIRALTGSQAFVKDAPVNLIYVADFSRMKKIPPADAEFYAATDTGFISQNVYLFCASSGLATVVRGWIDKPVLAAAMKLRPEQKIILAQTVGYPN